MANATRHRATDGPDKASFNRVSLENGSSPAFAPLQMQPSAQPANLEAGAIWLNATKGLSHSIDGMTMKLAGGRAQASALRPFWTALAKRETSRVDIVCVGTSLTEGSRVSTIEKRWTARLRDKLRTAYPVAGVAGGQGYICANYYLIQNETVGQGTQVFTQTGGSTDPSYLYGLGRRARKLSTAGDKLDITITCSSFDVVAVGGTSSAVFSLTIDGGAPVNIDTLNGTLWSGRWFNSGALTPGSHTVSIAFVSGNPVYIEGIMVYNGDETKGVRMWEAGHGGVESFYYNAGFWLTNPGAKGSLFNIQPSLVIIELGVNDMLHADASGTIATNVQTLIATVKSACTVAPSILLVAAHQVAGTWSEPWSNYVNALWSVALADAGVAMVDLNDLLGTANTASGLFYSDNTHINDSGSEFWANAIMGALAP